MNKLFLTLIIFVLFEISCASNVKDSQMEIQVTTNKLDSKEFKEHKGSFYSINIELVNNTDSIARLWVMSCSWQDNWIFNIDTMGFYSQGCDKNYPTIKEIGPRQKLTFNGVIHSTNSAKLNNQIDVRLGFVLIKEQDISKMSDFRNVLSNKIENQNEIIWSEPFNIGE